MLRLRPVVAVLALAAAAVAQSLVVPAGLAQAEGNSTNAFPWGRGGTGLLHQSVYDASHFLTQGVSYPVRITGARWRPDNGSALYASSYTGGCTIKLSTCPLNYAAVSSTLASNRGADETTCYSGVVSWAAQPAQPAPAPFGISVPFTTGFVYDPNLGDLVVECDLPVQTFTGSLPGMDVQTAAPLASRVFVSTGYPGTGTGTITQNHGVVVELTYVPAAPLYAAFTASATGGPTPLAVAFTSTSASTAAGGITSYAWDFNGDNVVDSTQPNPSWTYTACGNYTVSLTVTDGVNPPSTSRFVDFVRTDRIVADFTATVVGLQTVQFTDASNMPATSHAWDFNGDNVVDSTQPNPVWTFPNALPTAVKLTASRLCTAPSVRTRVVDVVQALTTNYTGNVGAGAGWTVYFDATVANPNGLKLRNLAINASAVATVGTPFTLDVYVKAGSYTGGFHTQPAAWRQVGTASGVSAANGTPSVATLGQPVYLPPGGYGVALRYGGLGPIYTLSTTSPTATYGNADLTLTLGASQNSSTAPFTGALNGSRFWNGTLYYETHDVTGSAGYGFFGMGCAGTLGPVTIPASSAPTLGGTLNVAVNNLPLGVAVMVVGTTRPPAVDLGFLGAPGCPLRVAVDATATVVGAGTSAAWSFAVPNAPALSGLQLFNQAASLDPALNAFGFALSDAHGWVLGG